MEQEQATTERVERQAFAVVEGRFLHSAPEDLYIPPNALYVFLEAFEGPLDLLLYLIKRQNIDILKLPITPITEQYIQYIEMMREFHLEIAAEYLAMAALLAEIKSRMLLPQPRQDEDEKDPRAELIRRLLEYQRFKQAADSIGVMQRMEKDTFEVGADTSDLLVEKVYPEVKLETILMAFQDALRKADLYRSHHIKREPLSIRERMTIILSLVSTTELIPFSQCFMSEEGRSGIVVSLLSLLEMLRSGIIEVVQTESYGQIYLRASSA